MEEKLQTCVSKVETDEDQFEKNRKEKQKTNSQTNIGRDLKKKK
jgi:hypothetical protein